MALLGCLNELEPEVQPNPTEAVSLRDMARPFKATLESTAIQGVDPPCDCGDELALSAAGGGHASHLGRVQSSGTACITSFIFNDQGQIIGSNVSDLCIRLIAANGDELYLKGEPHQLIGDPGCQCAEATLDGTIVGGTGRFAGAEGWIEIAVRRDAITEVYYEWYAGEIYY